MSMESWSTKSRRRKPPDVFTHLLTRPPQQELMTQDGLYAHLYRLHARFAGAYKVEEEAPSSGNTNREPGVSVPVSGAKA